MIGDRILDIAAAADVGVPSVGVTWGYGAPEELAGAAFLASNVDELKSALHRCRLYQGLAERLQEKVSLGSRPSIVGINGVDTAGKTCFAKEFASFLRAQGYDVVCVHLDDFHNPSARRKEGANEREAYINHAFDLDKLDRSVLAPFRETGTLDTELTLLDLVSDDFSVKRAYVANEKTMMLVEGTLLFREPVDARLDYRIFLHVPFSEVLRRAEARDVPLHGEGIIDIYRRKYIPIQEWYLETSKPEARADVVIDNTDFGFPRVEKIL